MPAAFAEKYGPWAVVAGASEGTGRALALELARRGLNLILVARRSGPLDELGAEIKSESNVECETLSLDLSAADATQKLAEAVGDREIGLYVGNAGSDPFASHFLDRPAEDWRALVMRNVVTNMACCHHFASAMRQRGRGALLLIGSGACYGGAAHMAAYAGSKAFELTFSEALWTELKPHGVDMLYYILGQTDTPAFRQFLADTGAPVPHNLASPDSIATLALDALSSGPVQNYGSGDDDKGFAPQSPAERRQRAEIVTQMSAPLFGAKS